MGMGPRLSCFLDEHFLSILSVYDISVMRCVSPFWENIKNLNVKNKQIKESKREVLGDHVALL